METNSYEQGRVTIFLEAFQTNILAKTNLCSDFHAHISNDLDLSRQNVPWQSIFGDAHGHHAARNRKFFEHCGLVSLSSQAKSRGQTCRSCTHNGHFLFSPLRHFGHIPALAGQVQIGQKPVEVLYGNGVVKISSGADFFAGMMANPAANCRKGMCLFKEFKGFAVLSLIYQCNVSLHAHVSRTGRFTRGCTPLFNGKSAGHRLRKELVGSFAASKPLVKEVGDFYRAYLFALTTGRALFQINVARVFQDLNAEIACLTVQLQDFCHGQKVDVEVSSALDQFGRDDTHGAIIRRERLVQLGHNPTNGRVLLHQIDEVAGVSQVQ